MTVYLSQPLNEVTSIPLIPKVLKWFQQSYFCHCQSEDSKTVYHYTCNYMVLVLERFTHELMVLLFTQDPKVL